MAVTHASLGLVGLVLLAGSLVLLWFIILAGVTGTTPLDKTYFLRADTSGISGAKDISQWTYFYICGLNNADCDSPHPALPLGAAWDSNPTGAPDALVGSYGGDTTSKYYWYMWRFGWVFFLIAIFFEVVAFFSGFLACCGRLGSAISGFVSLVALFFLTIAVSLMTATFVKMRNVFQDDGRDASIGTYAFGFAWGAWAALLIATVLFWIGVGSGRNRGTTNGVTNGTTSRRRWGRSSRRRSTRSKHSFDMGNRRVKDEYA